MTDEPLQAEVIEDARTGEIIPKSDSNDYKAGILTQINISTLGTLELDENAKAVLEEKLNPEDVQIRADGLVYLPWTWYNKRLNRAFGLLKWALAPYWFPQIKNSGKTDTIVWINGLVIKGVLVSVAGGETSYIPNNPRMTYGDALEGARSSSLARNCKNLGMALELWDADYVNAWKKHFAEYVDNPNGDYPKKIWRKKAPKVATGYHNDEIQTPEPQNSTQEPASAETTVVSTENASSPVSETNVPTYTGNQILGSHDGQLVKELVAMTHKTTADVCKVVGKFEKGKKYSLAEVAAMIVVPSQAPTAPTAQVISEVAGA